MRIYCRRCKPSSHQDHALLALSAPCLIIGRIQLANSPLTYCIAPMSRNQRLHLVSALKAACCTFFQDELTTGLRTTPSKAGRLIKAILQVPVHANQYFGPIRLIWQSWITHCSAIFLVAVSCCLQDMGCAPARKGPSGTEVPQMPCWNTSSAMELLLRMALSG